MIFLSAKREFSPLKSLKSDIFSDFIQLNLF